MTADARRRAHRTAMDHVLRAVAESPEELVLRGSVLLAHWYPEAAREPADIDLVAAEEDDPWAALYSVAQKAVEAAEGTPIRFDEDWFDGLTELWGYQRAPGARLLLPWTCEGTAGGTVQVDAACGEPMAVPPIQVELGPLGDGPSSRLPAASPELSLAWKIQWLLEAGDPESKDLYDAALLAEHSRIDHDLMSAVLTFHGGESGRPPGPSWLHAVDPGRTWEWEKFAAAHPRLAKTPLDELLARVRAVLEPVVDAGARRPEDGSEYPRRARWMAPAVERVRAGGSREWQELFRTFCNVRHSRGPDGSDRGAEGILGAAVVLRELRGGESMPLEDLAKLLAKELRATPFERFAPVELRDPAEVLRILRDGFEPAETP